MIPWPTDPDVLARIDRSDIPFSRYGIDPFGVDRKHLARGMSMMKWFYQNYFSMQAFDVDRIPTEGRAMLIGNHSGGIAVDGAMTATSLLLEMEPPRVAHAMAERFLQDIPFITRTLHRSGQLMGLPEHAMKILEADRLLMVFPEGARGTGKLYWEKYELVRFGTGFMRLALQTGSPIVPFGFVGGVEAMPTVYHSKMLARMASAPYFPITAYLLPVPRPYPCRVYFGEPLHFEGNGDETDDVIAGYVETVKESIRALIKRGLEERGDNT